MKKLTSLFAFCLALCLLTTLFSSCNNQKAYRSENYECVILIPVSNDTASVYISKKTVEILTERLINAQFKKKDFLISINEDNSIKVECFKKAFEGELKLLCSFGRLTFKDYAGNEWLNGESHVESAYAAQNQQDGGFMVVLNFTDRGAARFAEATNAIKGYEDNRLYIWLGDSNISAPLVNDQIVSTSAQITGYETYEDALSIASVIDSGRLPIEYTVSEARSISSKLGESAISNSAIMAGIGLLIIFAIMLIRYRGLGVASCISLIVYVLLYIVFLAIIPSIQLTLPGIAGILLAIGMAVDANIVVFERIREEFALGKTAEASVAHGFKHAAITVLDSNVTTIFAAIILWAVCPGTIKGFAITLLIGIVLALFTAILLSKWLLKVFSPLVEDQEKFLNLKREGGNN